MDSIFDRVRDEYSVSSIFTMLTGRPIEPNGFGTCPVCQSSRFQVTRSDTSWTCWSGHCHNSRGKDSLGLYAAACGIDRTEAAKTLLGDSRVDRLDYPVRKPVKSIPRAVSDDPAENQSWQEWIAGIVDAAQKALADPDCDIARRARVYLCRKRGLKPETVKAYGLGLNKSWIHSHVALPGREAKVAPGILIPWTCPGGYAGVNVREFHEKLPKKYLLATGSRRRWAWPGPFFNYDVHWAYEGPLLITEGEFDAIAAQEALAGLCAVKTIGASTAGPDKLVDSERAEFSWFTKLLIATDNDEAGRACLDMWQEYTPKAVPVKMPDGFKDLGEAHAAGFDIRSWFLTELERLGVGLGVEPGQDWNNELKPIANQE